MKQDFTPNVKISQEWGSPIPHFSRSGSCSRSVNEPKLLELISKASSSLIIYNGNKKRWNTRYNSSYNHWDRISLFNRKQMSSFCRCLLFIFFPSTHECWQGHNLDPGWGPPKWANLTYSPGFQPVVGNFWSISLPDCWIRIHPTLLDARGHRWKKCYISREYGPKFPLSMTKFPIIYVFLYFSDQNFPSVAKFPGNEIPRFPTFSRHG